MSDSEPKQLPRPTRDRVEEHVHPIVRFAVHRRVTLVMAVMGVLVLGFLSLSRLPLEFLPSFSSSSIWISAPYPSSSPAEVERLIIHPLEDSLGTLNGLETMSASASASSASINLSFVDGTDMDLAAVEVRDRVDRVRHRLPTDLDQLRIRRFQSTDIPVLRFHLAADWPPDRLFAFAEDVLQRRLERLDGVAQVDLRGLRTRELHVELDPHRMQALKVDSRSLAALLRENNVNLTGGYVYAGSRKLPVRAIGELHTLEEIRQLPINDRGLVLGDVAEVTYSFPRQEEFNFLNGREAMTVRINKASTANLLAVVDAAKAELAEIEAMPEAEGLNIRIYEDASDDVRQGLGQLRNAGFIGGGLAILSVFLFLRRPRTTLLIATAIPISVVFTFVLMYLLGQAGLADMTLNVISLAGLVLALGMLVDNSIVVVEAIFRHRLELGKDARRAALEGASEVALPIVASTATTMCVFLPLLFGASSGGRFNFYMKEIGSTVTIVMAASLLVALTVVPMMASLLLDRETARPSRLVGWLNRSYGSGLALTLRHRALFCGLIVLTLWGSWKLFNSIERTFSSRAQARRITIHVDTPPTYSLEQTRALFDDTAALLERHREELDVADMTYEYSRSSGRTRGRHRGGREFQLYLEDESKSKLGTIEIRDRVRELLPELPGVTFRIGQSQGWGGSTGIEIELKGEDPQVLELLSRQVAGQLSAMPMLRDVDTSLESGDQEIQVRVRGEQASRAGLSSQAVGMAVMSSLSNRAVSRFKTDDREVDLSMQFAEEDRQTLDQLRNLEVRGGAEARQLASLADFSRAPGPRTIEREDRASKVTVSANLADPKMAFAAMGMAGGMMNAMTLPPGYEWSFGFWNRYQQRDQEGSAFALLFSLVLIYMLMAALFESFTQPFTIMFAVPFAFIGVGLVMKLFNQPRDNMTELGLIILAGVVVNNAIVLVSQINRLRRQGLARTEAILEGGKQRLRPILMTAMTTILGLTPMVAPFLFPEVFGPVEGRASTWAPIGLVILGGLTTSTFLTLMVVPTIYSLIDDATRFVRRVARAA